MIVIPMAGRSRRFIEHGYSLPKFQLAVAGHTMFYWSVASFRRYFLTERFLFILNKAHDAKSFVAEQCELLGILQADIVELEADTRGQADTVALGLQRVRHDNGEPLTIFNIDTIRPNYELPEAARQSDGYIETFHGDGDGWSFVMPSDSGDHGVKYTTEKVRVSDHCSTGLYYFSSIKSYLYTYQKMVDTQLPQFLQKWKELYIAPLYNHVIEDGKKIIFQDIQKQDVIFSGIPSEYQFLLSDQDMQGRLRSMLPT